MRHLWDSGAGRYGDGPTAEYAESAEGASVVGIGGAVAHACGFVKCLNCDWGAENSLHWVLDMAFDEDRSRVRTGNADQNLAVVRHMAMNMLKQEQPQRSASRPSGRRPDGTMTTCSRSSLLKMRLPFGVYINAREPQSAAVFLPPAHKRMPWLVRSHNGTPQDARISALWTENTDILCRRSHTYAGSGPSFL